MSRRIIRSRIKNVAKKYSDSTICSKAKEPTKESADCYLDVYNKCHECMVEYFRKRCRK